MKYNSYANPFLSRKTYCHISEWWARTTFDGQMPLYKMAYALAPTGKFHCKEVSQYYFGKKSEGDIRVSEATLTIESPDDLSSIRPDDIVKYEGILYRIVSLGKREVAKTRENMRHPIYVFVLQLMRA